MFGLNKVWILGFLLWFEAWAPLRAWGDWEEPPPLPLPVRAVIAGNGVRVRSTPSLNAPVVGKFNGGESVFVLFDSSHTNKVEGEVYHWSQVLDRSATFGWVYGKYLRKEVTPPDKKRAYLFASLGQRYYGNSYQTNTWGPDQLKLVSGFDDKTRDLFIAYQCMRALKDDGYSSVPLKAMGSVARFSIPPLICSSVRIGVEDYDSTVWINSPHLEFLTSVAVSTQSLVDTAKAQFASGQYQGSVIDYIELLRALGESDAQAVGPKLMEAYKSLQDPDEYVYSEVLIPEKLIAEMKNCISSFELVSFFSSLTNSENSELRQLALQGLSQCEDVRSAIPRLAELVNDENTVVRVNAVSCLGKVKDDKKALSVLNGCLKDKDALVRINAVDAIGAGFVPDASKPFLMDLVKDPDEQIRSRVVKLFSKEPTAFMTPPLSGFLTDPVPDIRNYAEDIVLSLNTKEALQLVEKNRSVRFHASRSGWRWIKSISPEYKWAPGQDLVVVLDRTDPEVVYRGELAQEPCLECSRSSDVYRAYVPGPLSITEYAIKKRNSVAREEKWTIRTDELTLEGDPFPSEKGSYVLRIRRGDEEDGDVVPFWIH